jgi:hypothetical protein
MMRFQGGGVGHKSTREATNLFKMDRDRLDISATLDSDDCDMAIEFDDDSDEPENNEIVNEDTVDQEEEDDYGYMKEDSDSDDTEIAEVDYDDEEGDTDEDLGPEDDGGAVDPFMDELGYADL